MCRASFVHIFIPHLHSSSSTPAHHAAVMAAAVLPSSRGLARVSTSKGLLLILSLLSLVHVSSSVLTHDQIMMFRESMRTAVEYLKREKVENQRRTETLSELLDLAGSLNTKDQLEIFRENLQRAAKNARKQKADEKSDLTSRSTLTGDLLMQFQPTLELAKSVAGDSPSLEELINISERLLEKGKVYLRKRMKNLDAENLKSQREL